MKITKVDLGFSTADAEIKSILNLKWHELVLNLIDWNDNFLKITFKNVIAYSFQYKQSKDYKGDMIYIVEDSEWLSEQLVYFNSDYSTDDTCDIVHLKLCFNVDNEELNIICHRDVTIEKESTII